MNYYERHIGDYLKDTSHLSLLEHGVYTRLMDVYYTREQAIPEDKAARLVGARTETEMAALQAVLSEFFTLDGDGWHQKRMDLEIAKFRAGEPERKAKKANEEVRLKRHRDERAALFKTLSDAGEHAPWTTGIKELRELVAKVERKPSDQPAAPPATPPATLQVTETATPATQPEMPDATPTATAHATLATATQTQTQTHFPVPNSLNTPISPQGGSKRPPTIGLRGWIEVVVAAGETPIPEGDPVFTYAADVGIPIEFLRLAWLEFRHKYGQPDAKRYRDWRAVFRRAIRGNWLRLWYVDANGEYQLTTPGQQAKRAHEERKAAATA